MWLERETGLRGPPSTCGGTSQLPTAPCGSRRSLEQERVLAAHLISCLQQATMVLFFFFCQNYSPHALVCKCIAQLLPYSPQLQARLDTLREEKRDFIDIAFQELWQILLNMIPMAITKVYCVVDALDEADSDYTQDFLQCSSKCQHEYSRSADRLE